MTDKNKEFIGKLLTAREASALLRSRGVGGIFETSIIEMIEIGALAEFTNRGKEPLVLRGDIERLANEELELKRLAKLHDDESQRKAEGVGK